jgi:hypothetical protein
MMRLLALIVALLAGSAWAIDPPKVPSPSPVPPVAAPVPEAPPEPAPEPAVAEQEELLPPLPPGAATAGPAPQRFIPSEKVRADFPVAFPIDI